MTAEKPSPHSSLQNSVPMTRPSLFNGAINAQIHSSIPCNDEECVQKAVRCGASQNLPIAVIGGGHDMWGRGFLGNNLVIDLAGMSNVFVNELDGEVTFAGGALVSDILSAIPNDRVVAMGTVLSVGLTGQALGGGYGLLTSRFGLTADNMINARVVLADGSVVVANERENADLFWALRGGGSGFGVVTSMTLAMHHLPQIFTAMILVSLDHALEAMLAAQNLIDLHPVDLSIFMGFFIGPEGKPVLFLSPLWTGSKDQGESVVRQCAATSGAVILTQRWAYFNGTFNAQYETEAFPKGAHYHLLTRNLDRLDEQSIGVLLEGARQITSPKSAIILHDFHGVASRVGVDATAFPLRQDHYVVEIIANWPAEDIAGAVQHRHWAEHLSSELATISLPGGYTSLLSPSETQRVRDFYGSAEAKLRAIKRKYDPHDVFCSGIGRLD
jgi:hypothetical protein